MEGGRKREEEDCEETKGLEEPLRETGRDNERTEVSLPETAETDGDEEEVAVGGRIFGEDLRVEGIEACTGVLPLLCCKAAATSGTEVATVGSIAEVETTRLLECEGEMEWLVTVAFWLFCAPSETCCSFTDTGLFWGEMCEWGEAEETGEEETSRSSSEEEADEVRDDELVFNDWDVLFGADETVWLPFWWCVNWDSRDFKYATKRE